MQQNHTRRTIKGCTVQQVLLALHANVTLSSMSGMGRRQFVALLGGAAVVGPLAARAQQTERVRRVGVLMSVAADGPDGRPRLAAFLKRLQELGWTDGQNVRIDVRWGAGEAERTRKYV